MLAARAGEHIKDFSVHLDAKNEISFQDRQSRMTIVVVLLSQMPTESGSSLGSVLTHRGKWIVEKPECGTQEEQDTAGLWEPVIKRLNILKSNKNIEKLR